MHINVASQSFRLSALYHRPLTAFPMRFTVDSGFKNVAQRALYWRLDFGSFDRACHFCCYSLEKRNALK